MKGTVLPVLEAAESATSGQSFPPELVRLRNSGVIVIALPSLVAMDVIMATPRLFRTDAGEALVLDQAMNVVAGPVALGTLPALPGGTTGGTIAEHIVRVLSFDNSNPAPATQPVAAVWLLLRPPAQPAVKKEGLDDASFLLEICGITLADWLEHKRATKIGSKPSQR